jgi:hypothetical protein
MCRRLCIALLLAAALPGVANAGEPNHVFEGGTPTERATVRAAFAASAFPWEIVRTRVVVHIRPDVPSHASPGHVWLDSHLLDAGRFSWGVVQHEFAHEVDFLVLNDASRAVLAARLGGAAWWPLTGTSIASSGPVAHSLVGAERFASTLAWAYWPSRNNVMEPESPGDESAALPVSEFRALLASVLSDSRRSDQAAIPLGH